MKPEIDDFFEDTNIFITGCSGFMGKVLVEKLLRSQANINKLYLLIRPKKGKTVEDRAHRDIFSKVIFDELRRTQPDFMKKIVIIPGDISKPQLDLSDKHKDLLLNEVNVVYNTAASVNMNAPLKDSIRNNIYSVIQLLDICRKMKSLKSIVVLSTAYSNSDHEIIEEKVYKSSVSPDLILRMCEEIDDKLMEKITPSILGNHPNTYTFSKSLLENMLEGNQDLPIVIFRPAIVLPAYKEPLVGWVDNYNGIVRLGIGFALGIARVFYMDEDKKFNWVPVDHCNNALICSAWHGSQKSDMTKYKTEISVCRNRNQLPVYNFAYDKKKRPWKDVFIQVKRDKLKLNAAIWKPSYVFAKNARTYQVLRYILHYLPALIMDLFLALIGNRLRLRKVYNEQMYPHADVLHYFTSNAWTIKETNTEIMWNDLTESEKQRYPFDSNSVDFDEMMRALCIGVKTYVVREKMEDNYKATRRDRMLTALHYITLSLVFIGLGWILYASLTFICG